MSDLVEPTIIISKNSSIPNTVPAEGTLAQGEIALNTADKKMWVGGANGEINLVAKPTPGSLTNSTLRYDGADWVENKSLLAIDPPLGGGTATLVLGQSVSGGTVISNATTGSSLNTNDTGKVTIAGPTGSILKGDSNGAAELFYRAASRLTTTYEGVSVSGTINANNITISGEAYPKGSTTITVNQSNHGFQVSKAIYWDGSKWSYALADNIETLALGIIVEIVSPSTFIYSTSGKYSYAHGLSPNQWYYLSDAFAGELTETIPSGIEQPMVFTQTSNTLTVFPYRPSLSDNVIRDGTEWFVGTGTPSNSMETNPGDLYLDLSLIHI